jgi:hypothetical protein
LETSNVRSTDGRRIAAYRFADPSQVRHGRLGGRKVFAKRLKGAPAAEGGCRCLVCPQGYEPRLLQIDHRVPYEVSGDGDGGGDQPQDYMLLCGSCNRAKSWSCEHRPNWLHEKDAAVCLVCYWANQAEYRHIALREVRRLDLVWTADEVASYGKPQAQAKAASETMPDYVKKALKRHTDGD